MIVGPQVDLPTVAAPLGHSRLDTVRIYGQPDEATLGLRRASLERDVAIHGLRALAE
jgi:hypothetical protein